MNACPVYSLEADLSCVQLRFGRKEIAAQHWMGLHEVIRSRGGFSKMQCSHPLKATLAWLVLRFFRF